MQPLTKRRNSFRGGIIPGESFSRTMWIVSQDRVPDNWFYSPTIRMEPHRQSFLAFCACKSSRAVTRCCDGWSFPWLSGLVDKRWTEGGLGMQSLLLGQSTARLPQLKRPSAPRAAYQPGSKPTRQHWKRGCGWYREIRKQRIVGPHRRASRVWAMNLALSTSSSISH